MAKRQGIAFPARGPLLVSALVTRRSAGPYRGPRIVVWLLFDCGSCRIARSMRLSGPPAALAPTRGDRAALAASIQLQAFVFEARAQLIAGCKPRVVGDADTEVLIAHEASFGCSAMTASRPSRGPGAGFVLRACCRSASCELARSMRKARNGRAFATASASTSG